MKATPPLSDNVKEFLTTLHAALDYLDLNLGTNFCIHFTDPHPDFGVGALFTQLNVKRSRVSMKAAKASCLLVETSGLWVYDPTDPDGERKARLPFQEGQPPHEVAALVAAALISQKPLMPPACPHCEAEKEAAHA